MMSSGAPSFSLKLTTKDSCGVGGGGAYSDFWFVDQAGDTINQYTGSGMWLPNPSDPMFDTTEYIIQLRPGYANFPTNFSGNFHIVNPHCAIPFTYSNLTAIETIEFESLIELFPNPASDVIEVLNKSDRGIASNEVYDSYGRLIKLENESTNFIRINTLMPGIYFVKLYSDERTIATKKLIKN